MINETGMSRTIREEGAVEAAGSGTKELVNDRARSHPCYVRSQPVAASTEHWVFDEGECCRNCVDELGCAQRVSPERCLVAEAERRSSVEPPQEASTRSSIAPRRLAASSILMGERQLHIVNRNTAIKLCFRRNGCATLPEQIAW